MPTANNANIQLHYISSGDNEGDALVLGHSLGSNLHMWDKTVQHLEKKYRVVRFDLRGHGKSCAPPGPYSLDDLGRDVLFLLDALDLTRVHYCGLSLSGMVGLWLGIHAPERIRHMVLANTAARIGSRSIWEQRIAAVESSGMKPLAEATLMRWFTAPYRESHEKEMDFIVRMIAATDQHGYSACCAALRDADLTNEAAAISNPCLVIIGRHDPATPSCEGRSLHNALLNSDYVELEASHLSAWERADDFSEAVLSFLEIGGTPNE